MQGGGGGVQLHVWPVVHAGFQVMHKLVVWVGGWGVI
jgi:hypothetical protein